MEDKFESCKSLNNTSNQLFKSVFFLYYFKIFKILAAPHGANKFRIETSPNGLVEYYWRVWRLKNYEKHGRKNLIFQIIL